MKSSQAAAKSKKPQAKAASAPSRYIQVLNESEVLYDNWDVGLVTQQSTEELGIEYPGLLEEVGLKRKNTRTALLELELAHERMECATMLKEMLGTRDCLGSLL